MKQLWDRFRLVNLAAVLLPRLVALAVLQAPATIPQGRLLTPFRVYLPRYTTEICSRP